MNAVPRIPLSRPSITDAEVALVTDAIQNGWGDRCYDYIHRFEQAFADHVGVRHAIATSSCTGALHMGMAALGIGPGDEVILADTNWVASVAPVMYLGAQPVLVDVLPDTWCLDPQAVRAAISPRTKAIIAVHLYGNLCHMDELLALGQEFGIPVIEDAAEAMGSVYHGRRAGAMGAFGAFSFPRFQDHDHGRGRACSSPTTPSSTSTCSVCPITAGCAGNSASSGPRCSGSNTRCPTCRPHWEWRSCSRVEQLVERRRAVYHRYQAAFAGVPGITVNPELPGTTIGAWMPTVVLAPELGVTAEALLQAFKEANIDARPFFAPLSTLPWMPPGPTGRDAQGLYERAVNLPSFHDMTEVEIERVVAVVLQALHHG